MPLDIAVGQQWKTRSGRIVRVTFDRGSENAGARWRWALSNSDIADTDGRIDINGNDHPGDLVERLEDWE